MRAPDPLIGRDLLNGQFQIVRKIGTGGMGAVYEASQPSMNSKVAVKILHAKLANRKDLVSRFHREAAAMSHLTHPNTVKVLLYGEDEKDGLLYIVMEYLDGKNLNQTVRAEGPLPAERAIPILVQACHALQEAHERGIVHRDLKPENIFLCAQGGMKDFVKVLDFGLAKVTEREMRPGSIVLTQEGMVFGTPEFMSPEQAQGKTLDARSDIYSLAVILYEVLTGKLPFDAKSPMEYIQLHVQKEPITLSQRVPGKTFPPALDQVIAKALAKDREDRYQTAAEFAAALQQAVGVANPITHTVSPTGISPLAGGASVPPKAPEAATPNPGPPATSGVVAATASTGSRGVPLPFLVLAFVLGIAVALGIAFVAFKR
ncbi:MAG: serine/threonine protein kinase [Polyangiales bacterium]